jgi:UDP-N-acetylmuramoylalanine--D-glutamate ligase
MVAVTGTDGKTTTTLLATAMVDASGRRPVAAGNTELPLVAALGLDVDVFVVECTSFRLRFAESFAPTAATWLNLAPDHLDWHGTLDAYIAAKARIWEHQGPRDVAIGFADDEVVARRLASAPARHVSFAATGADYRIESGWLAGPSGRLVEVAALGRTFPHDLTNTLAAAATVLEGSVADAAGVAAAASSFAGVAHRISYVATRSDVAYYDDSKATTPHAALTAMRGFDSVVLIAGGRNKDLDLSAMAGASEHVRAVVAIGEAAGEIEAAFAGVRPVVTARSMEDAVTAAGELARPGDAVLLSPGCASFDWYANYAARGDDFARLVRARSGS